MKKVWLDLAWEDYEKIQEDRRLLKKTNKLLKEIERNPNSGIGKPELLKDDLSGYTSRRIDDYNRIVYKVEGENLRIVQCGTHYHK